MARERLPNKVIWNIEDIKALCIDLQRDWDKAFALAERSQDPLMLVHLGRMGKSIGAISIKATNARNSEYEEAA